MSDTQFTGYYLCSLTDFKTNRYSGRGGVTALDDDGNPQDQYDANDDGVIAYCIQQASSIIARQILNRLPLPYVATKLYDAPGGSLLQGSSSRCLDLVFDDLIAVTTLTNGDATTIAASAFKLYPSNSYPKDEVRIKSQSSTTFTYTDNYEQAISVAGIWGYVPHYDNAFIDTTDDIPAGGITASATTFTLDTVANAVNYSRGLYLRLEDEYVLVTDVVTDTGVITIARGVLGTTAATHDAGIAIERFEQDFLIRSTTAMYASALYNQERGVYDDGVAEPDDALQDARSKLLNHIKGVTWAL